MYEYKAHILILVAIVPAPLQFNTLDKCKYLQPHLISRIHTKTHAKSNDCNLS